MLRRSNGARPKERRAVTLDDRASQAQYAAEGLLERALTAMRRRVSADGKHNMASGTTKPWTPPPAPEGKVNTTPTQSC